MSRNLTKFAWLLGTLMLVSGPAAATSVIVQQPLSPCIDKDTGKPFAPKPSDVVADSDAAGSVPWGVQIAGGFSRIAARKQFDQVQQANQDLLGSLSPTVVISCKLNLGQQLSYSMTIGEQSRDAADDLCNELLAKNVACVVQKN